MAPPSNKASAIYESEVESHTSLGGGSSDEENGANDHHLFNAIDLSFATGSSQPAVASAAVESRRKDASPVGVRPSRLPTVGNVSKNHSSLPRKESKSATDGLGNNRSGDRRSPFRDRDTSGGSTGIPAAPGSMKAVAGGVRDNGKQVFQVNGTVRVKGRRSFGDFPMQVNGSSASNDRSPKTVGTDRAPGSSSSSSSLHPIARRAPKLASSADSAAIGKMKRAERGGDDGSSSPVHQSGELPSNNSGSSLPRPQASQIGGIRGTGLHTVPVPFHFATDRRASTGNRTVASPPAEMEKKTNQPSAGHLPSSLKAPKVPPKPSPKPSTSPCPFKLASVRRHEAAVEKLKAELTAKKSEEERQRTFRAQPVAAVVPFVPHRSSVPPTHVRTFQFASTVRAEKRREFQTQLEEKENAKEAGTGDKRASFDAKMIHGVPAVGSARPISPKVNRSKSRPDSTGNSLRGSRGGAALIKSKSANASMSSSDGGGAGGGTLSNGGESNAASETSSDYRSQVNDAAVDQIENAGVRAEASVVESQAQIVELSSSS